MKIVGLITEYNPFHNGHKYHIDKAKEITGADYVIAVMSGDFVQRGTPALLPKHLRTEMALDGGCDMVIELPVYYATGSAEYFASGAISILDKLGCVDSICFGSECGDYDNLKKIARILVDEPSEYQIFLQQSLKQGHSFPIARQQALKEYLCDTSLNSILDEPNNILGIEYIKAMLLQNSSMEGYTLRREGSSYHDERLSERYSSASAIRKSIINNDKIAINNLDGHLPASAINLMKANYKIRFPVVLDDFSLILRYKLLTETKESLQNFVDVTPDLANRIINSRNSFITFTQFCDLLKTKELTYSRISRCLIHILLNIRKDCYPTESYAHILGFRKESQVLFTKFKTFSKIPVVTKLQNFIKSDNQYLNTKQFDMLKQDIFASDLYESIVSNKYNLPFTNELQKQIVKL